MLPCVGINVVTPMDGDAVGSKVGRRVEFEVGRKVGCRVEFVVSLYMKMSRRSIVILEYIFSRCV